jgi:TolA-binding protein
MKKTIFISVILLFTLSLTVSADTGNTGGGEIDFGSFDFLFRGTNTEEEIINFDLEEEKNENLEEEVDSLKEKISDQRNNVSLAEMKERIAKRRENVEKEFNSLGDEAPKNEEDLPKSGLMTIIFLTLGSAMFASLTLNRK